MYPQLAHIPIANGKLGTCFHYIEPMITFIVYAYPLSSSWCLVLKNLPTFTAFDSALVEIQLFVVRPLYNERSERSYLVFQGQPMALFLHNNAMWGDNIQRDQPKITKKNAHEFWVFVWYALSLILLTSMIRVTCSIHLFASHAIQYPHLQWYWCSTILYDRLFNQLFILPL